MIDNRIVKLLDNPDPEQRKRAVKALAQTKNPDALKYLSTVIRTDSDREVTLLARKAEAYIKKFAPVEEEEEELDLESRLMGGGTSGGSWGATSDSRAAFYEEKPESEREPLPEEIIVTEADATRAQRYVEQALSAHMREDNSKAAQLLGRAFQANPKLRSDSYVAGLAATVTGLSTPDAVQMLAPSADELRRRAARNRAQANAPTGSGLHRLLATIILVAAAILIFGYIAAPWIDLSPLMPTSDTIFADLQNQTGMSIDQLRQVLQDSSSGIPPAQQKLLQDILNAIDNLNGRITGLDTTLITIGAKSPIEAMGLGELFKELLPDFDMSTTIVASENPLDFTLLLVPLVIIVAPIIGLVLLSRGGFSVPMWVFGIVLGLVGLIPFWWFYTDSSNQLVNGADLAALGGATTSITSGSQLIGIGFWICLVAQLAILFLPFVALMVPAQGGDTAEEKQSSRLLS